MAILKNSHTCELVVLRPYHTFGREPSANISVLPNSTASRRHAVIAWDGEGWMVKDTSSNGTFINDVRLASQSGPLGEGDKITFGDPRAEVWQLESVAAPRSFLEPLSKGLPPIELYKTTLLPLMGREVVVYQSEQGGWLCRDEGEVATLKTEDKVGAGKYYWRFIDVAASATTTVVSESEDDSNFHFNFKVSRNEEHVSLEIVSGDKTYNMGERNHHYILLLLARQRLKDRQAGVREAEQGWIKKDLLIRMLGMREQHINIQIHRFRRQVAELLPADVALGQVIARRTSELRLAYDGIVIEGGHDVKKIME